MADADAVRAIQGDWGRRRPPVESYAGDKSVVERAFKHVIVFRIAVEKEKTVVDVDVADGGACLTVGRHIGQLVVLAESLSLMGGSDSSGDIVFLADDIVPDIVDGLYICGVA